MGLEFLWVPWDPIQFSWEQAAVTLLWVGVGSEKINCRYHLTRRMESMNVVEEKIKAGFKSKKVKLGKSDRFLCCYW